MLCINSVTKSERISENEHVAISHRASAWPAIGVSPDFEYSRLKMTVNIQVLLGFPPEAGLEPDDGLPRHSPGTYETGKPVREESHSPKGQSQQQKRRHQHETQCGAENGYREANLSFHNFKRVCKFRWGNFLFVRYQARPGMSKMARNSTPNSYWTRWPKRDSPKSTRDRAVFDRLLQEAFHA